MLNIESKSMIIMKIKKKITTILGLLWYTEPDVYKYKIEITENNDLPVTKRNVLS